MASRLEKASMLPKVSTVHTPETACTAPKASTERMPRRLCALRRDTTDNKPLAIEGNNKPLATRDGNLPGKINEPLATRANDRVHCTRSTISRIRAAYIVQSNNKPLTTKSNWARTFDNHEGAKAPGVKLIVPITIPHHCNKAS